MVLRNANSPLTPEVRELQLQLSSQRSAIDDLNLTIGRIANNVSSLLQSRLATPAAPVGNLLFNGECGHSVNSWFDSSYVTTDISKEAAHWFSHFRPAKSQTFTTITTINTIPVPNHQFQTGQTVDLITTGTLPSGGASSIAASTLYFVYVVDANNVKLASTLALALAGTPNKTFNTGTGSGTHTIQERLVSTDGRTSSTNNTLKTTGHSTYNAHLSRWDSTNGLAQIQGLTSLDALLPANIIDATTPLAQVSFILAKRNEYIEFSDTARLYAGIWDNTSGQRKFLTGSAALNASVVGTPAVGVERRYRIYITSDRGYTILSEEVTVATAPKDSEFDATTYVALNWRQQAGQLQVDIYEYLPNGPEGVSAAEYRLVNTISSGTSYIHLGSYLPKTVTGYPSASTDTERVAIYGTESGVLADISIDGVSVRWDTCINPIGVPNNYNKGNTTDRQWMRIWTDEAANLYVEGCTTDGSTTITAPAAVFESEYDALFDAGTLAAEVYDAAGTLLATTTVASRTDNTHVVLGTTVTAGSGRALRIVGGGFHGLLVDKIHLGYQQNTTYAPNANDFRTLQPVAAPSQSTQGGVGSGSTGGGIISCVAYDTPIKQADDEWKQVQDSRGTNDRWASGGLRPNVLVQLRPGMDFVRAVRSANGCFIRCTDTERFVTSPVDEAGTQLYKLRIGDKVMTEIDGKAEVSTIAFIGPRSLQKIIVYTPELMGSHLFIAGVYDGQWVSDADSGIRSFIRRMTRRLMPVPQRKGGFILHNNKRPEDP